MSSDIVIRAEGLGKKYVIGHEAERERYTALRDVIGRQAKTLARTTVDMLRGRAVVAGDTMEEFWALKDIDFEIKRGEIVGIIGRNGAGKSTLLKILSRITEPSTGQVEIRGRVSSLLKVGTGFHPELTGRENIYLNGAILGMTRAEIRRKFDDIVAFAEVEKFLDTPVKRYSSGMYVRLAFAVAAHLEPEILVVDEVLAVGDAEFQKKCLGKLGEVAGEGRTILFVSHNMGALQQITSVAMLLSAGRIVKSGATSEVVEHYLAPTITDDSFSGRIGDEITRKVEVDSLLMNGQNHRHITVSSWPYRLELAIGGRIATRSRLALEARLLTSDGTVLASFCPGHFDDAVPILEPGPFEISAGIEIPRLTTEHYYLSLSLVDPGLCGHWKHDLALDVVGRHPSSGVPDLTRANGHGSLLLDGTMTALIDRDLL